jgi:hypothetical protein
MRMPEGLRNIGPTFCRMTKAPLKDQIGRNVLSYVDDIIVASKKKESYISDMSETLGNMREASLKLNPEMCIFRVTRGKVLGCLVSTKTIEASPNKIRAIIQCNLTDKERSAEANRPHSNTQQVHREASRKRLPFFNTLHGSTKVDWGAEQQQAFDDLKCYLEHLPTL